MRLIAMVGLAGMREGVSSAWAGAMRHGQRADQKHGLHGHCARGGVGLLGVILLAGSLFFCQQVRADVVYDFESFAGNQDHTAGDFTALTVESSGIFAVITRTSGERFTIWDSQNIQMPSDWGTKHISPAFNLTEDDYMLMSFSQPLASVTIEFGDFGQDQDLAEVFAYDQLHGAGNLVGYSSGDMGDSDIRRDAATSLTVNASQGQEIWSVRFRGGIDPFYQSTFIDNIRVTLVPTPGTLTALGLSLAVCSHRLRRPRPTNARAD